nr:hypothetical protein [Actinomycetota bacterium]
IPSPVVGLQLVKGLSGRVRSATVTSAAGPRTVTGGVLRSGLGLRSTWITSLASLSLARSAGPVLYGRAVALRADAKGVRNAVLAQRVDGVWSQVAGRPSGGAFAFSAKLSAPTSFRLSAGAIVGPIMKVPVAPLVRISPLDGGLAGTVLPATPGAVVEVQQLDGVEWLPAGEAMLDEVGAFTAGLEPGTYRARIAPAAGFAEGLSPQLRIG